MRTEDAVTKAERRLDDVLARRRSSTRARARRSWSRCARWRGAGARRTTRTPTCPTARADPRRSAPRARHEQRRRRRRRCCGSGVTAYAVFGGADFGAGFWSLVAGGGDRGRRARELIDWAIGPVWEANHVWLIFVLVVLWTGFSTAFESIFSTLFIPLSLAALGIVLRGVGLRLPQDRAAAARARARRAPVRALVAADAVLHGHRRRRHRVGPGAGRQRRRRPGHELAQPASLLIGALFVATSAYLAAVFLVSDARRAGAPTSSATSPPGRSAAAVAAGVLAVAGIIELHADARYVYDGLTSDALPLVIVSALCGVAVLVLLRRGARRGARRWRSAPSSPSSGAGASPSTRTCCRRS